VTLAPVSLFDKPIQPVLGGASEWVRGLLGGTLATSLCVIAIALLGFLLLAGRLRVPRSVEVVLGCFLLLGAGLVAAQLQRLASSATGAGARGGEEVIMPTLSPPEPPRSRNYDLHAGASLPRD